MKYNPHREELILSLSDDDFQTIGVSLEDLTDEEYHLVVESLQEYYHESFLSTLKMLIDSVKEGETMY